ncbi:MAG: L-rhamnose isomerase, partial [Chthoniobacteraceae bacterium]
MSTPYNFAQESYAALDVQTEGALDFLARVPISLPCWQGDDVRGFDRPNSEPGGGLAVTGAFPGRARTPDELRADLETALRLIPGRHRVNLHASYAEPADEKIDRDGYTAAHFQGWIDWAKARGLGLDFNPTFFAHPLAADGVTLTHRDSGIRDFWIQHGMVCRRVAAEMGHQLCSPVVTNVWIPDGSKEAPIDRLGPRLRLAEALDRIFSETLDPAMQLDAVESKLFGIGSENYVAGSHEFYLGYAITRQKLLCLDAGHFHPTESVADKISSTLPFVPGLLLHLSRGVRWDSDHVVLLDDPTRAILEELV